MDTFGVSKDVIVSCLNFRNEMLNYLGTRPADENRDEFCSKTRNIYKAFGCDIPVIKENDLVCRTYHYDGELQNNFMFPVYDNLRFLDSYKAIKTVLTVMSPLWESVKSSRDLALLLEHRSDNKVFDEVLFVLVITGAWKFADFIKMCGDFSIITDRFYNVDSNGKSDGDVGERRVNGYPCLPFKGNFCKLEDFLARSFIGFICVEKSVSEVLKYDKCAKDLQGFVESNDVDVDDLLLDEQRKSSFIRNFRKVELICKPRCDILEASKGVNDYWFKQLLQKLSILDVTRRYRGLGSEDDYLKVTSIKPELLLHYNIYDRGLFGSVRASVIRDGVEVEVTVG